MSNRTRSAGLRRAAVAFAVIAAGCGIDRGSAARDLPASAGELTERYRFGGTEAPDWAVIGERVQLDFDRQGRLHVLDAANSRTFVVSTQGTLDWEYERAGRGPGELQLPVAFAVDSAGGQVIADLGNRSLISLSPAGEPLGNTPIDVESGFPSGTLLSFGHELLASMEADAFGMAVDPEATTTSVRAYTVGASGWRTVFEAWGAPLPGGEAQSLTVGGRTMRVRAAGLTNLKAFWPTVRIARAGDLIAIADSTTYAIELIRLDGSSARTVRRPIEPTPVTPDLEADERGRRLDALAAGEGPRFQISNSDGSSQAVDPDLLRGFMADQIEATTFWPEIPVVHRMLGSPDGALWVQRAATDGSGGGRIDWMSASGEYLGTLPVNAPYPAALGPNGLEAYLRADELGIVEVTVMARSPTWGESSR